MPSILLTGPAVEPWSVEEAKSFLRAENDDDDTVIASLIAAARSHVEAMTRCALIAQTWRVVLDQWPKDGRIKPGRGPLRALTAARIYNSAGIATPIDAGTFVLDKAAGVITSSVWMLPGRVSAGIELDVEIGFGEAASDVPDVLRHAVRTLSSASNRFSLDNDLTISAKQAAILRYDGTAARWQAIAGGMAGAGASGGGFLSPPQGRLTLASGVPVMTTTQSAKTTLYYAPYTGNRIPVYNGAEMVPTAFASLKSSDRWISIPPPCFALPSSASPSLLRRSRSRGAAVPSSIRNLNSRRSGSGMRTKPTSGRLTPSETASWPGWRASARSSSSASTPI